MILPAWRSVLRRAAARPAARYIATESHAFNEQWALSQSWLRIEGEEKPLTVEFGVLQICEDSDAVSAGASSVLALTNSEVVHNQWSGLAAALRRQQTDAITAYDAGGSPQPPIWSTPRAVCAPFSFGYGNTSYWPDTVLSGGTYRLQSMDDHVRLVKAAAAAAHAARSTAQEGLDNKVRQVDGAEGVRFGHTESVSALRVSS